VGSIEWTGRSDWNPIRGCSLTSPGCRNCYAMRMASRFSGPGQPFEGYAADGKWTGRVELRPERLGLPLSWRAPSRVFVNSMSDLFHENLSDEDIATVFGAMSLAPWHTFQVLTKRADRMAAWFKKATHENCAAAFVARADSTIIAERTFNRALNREMHVGWPWPLPNVHLGVSVESSDYLHRVDDLMRCPAAVRFLSLEPLLSPIELPRFIKLGRPVGSDVVWLDDHKFASVSGMRPVAAGSGVHRVYLNKNGARSVAVTCGDCHGKGCPGENPYPCRSGKTSLGIKPDECTDLGLGVDWVIVGGESGAGARPMHPSWVRSIRDQCKSAGVPFFFKQWGEFVDGSVRDAPGYAVLSDGTSCVFTKDACEALASEHRGEWGRFSPTHMARVGKKAAGALLDGREHREFPLTKGAES
jgi:protein gp37